jgi:diguanylate cyclase (GGDEF)-like protein
MNYYNLPEFISYAILVGIALALIREHKKQVYLRYWLAGWIIILMHAGVYMLIIPDFIANLIGRGLLASAGLAFMAAANWKSEISTASSFPKHLWVSLPNVAFAVLSADYPKAGYGTGPFAWLLGLTVVSLGCALWDICVSPGGSLKRRQLLALSCIAFGTQAGLLFSYGSVLASQWQMCWIYFAVAYFCVRQIPSFTMGVAFLAISFTLWGLVFPVYSLLQLYAPAISQHIEPMIWNLPKFLTAASMILVLLEEKVARATLLATHDELTGLPNRRLYEDRFLQALTRAQRTNKRFAILIIDLDRFKQVNDTLGHHAGDELLKHVSGLFRQALRASDTIARTGGDEFTALLEEISGMPEAEQWRDAIRQSLNVRLSIERADLDPEASIGLAVFPEDGKTQLELHSVADHRMYQDKELSRLRAGSSSGKSASNLATMIESTKILPNGNGEAIQGA